MKHKRCIAVILALGAVILDAQADSPSVQVRLAPVTQQTVSEVLTVYGRVQPDPDAVLTVAMPYAGLITRVAARLGERVKRGDTLIEPARHPRCTCSTNRRATPWNSRAAIWHAWGNC